MIKLEGFVKALKLGILYDADVRSLDIETSDINRPGLQLAGFFDYFDCNRVQVFGKAEVAYLDSWDSTTRAAKLDRLFQYNIPCVIISHGLQPHPEMLECARKYKRPIFSSTMVATRFVSALVAYLNNILAPTTSIHGVFVDVYGVGILLTGESGIGKSETALELIKRGHRLVADDAVSIRKVSDDRLVGESPEIIRHLMEIRGIGIIDIRNMYGVGAVIHSKSVDLVTDLENWDENKEYDRLGLDHQSRNILGVEVPMLTIPVRPGRNLAIIIEVAARNFRLIALGYNSAEQLVNRLSAAFESKEEEH